MKIFFELLHTARKLKSAGCDAVYRRAFLLGMVAMYHSMKNKPVFAWSDREHGYIPVKNGQRV